MDWNEQLEFRNQLADDVFRQYFLLREEQEMADSIFIPMNQYLTNSEIVFIANTFRRESFIVVVHWMQQYTKIEIYKSRI